MVARVLTALGFRLRSLQRVTLMDDRCVLMSVGSALVIHVHASCHGAGIAIVMLYEILIRVRLTSITLYPLYYALAAYRTVVRNIIVHAGVPLRPEHSTTMHKAAFIDIHYVAVAVIENEMTPSYIVPLAGQRQILIPAQGEIIPQIICMRTATATASINESIVIDILVTEFAEPMSASFMLHYSTRIERITISAQRAERYCRAVFPHLADATVVSRVRDNNDHGLVEVVFVYCRCAQSVVEYRIIVGSKPYSTGECGVETIVTYRVHRANAGLCRERKRCIDIEIIAISSVRLYVKEILNLFFNILEVIATSNVTCIKAISEQDYVYAAIVAFLRLL